MSKAKYIILLLIAFSTFACSFVEDDIFGNGDGDRIDNTLKEYLEILSSAENGWLLEYYPNDTKFGGFNLYLNFSKDGKVSITGETPILKEDNEKITSLFALKADMGPLLSFDTYNRILHQFSDPEPDGLGYEGDYEFIIMSANNDTISLKGKKHGIKMNMVKFPKDKTWQDFSRELDTIIKYNPGFTMELQVNNEKISFSESAEIGRYLSTSDISETDGVPYIYTLEGIKFKEPVKVHNQTLQHFKWSGNNANLICIDENVTAQINHMPLNQAFINKRGNWFFDGERMGTRFTSLWNEIVENLDKKANEQLLFVYLRSPYELLSLYSYSRNDKQAFNANFYLRFYALTKEQAMEDGYEGDGNRMVRLSLDEEAVGDQMALLFYYEYFRTFRLYLTDEAPYELVYNNLKIPNEISFTRLDDPEKIWFILSK
ncbi:DUF4302 domain-containing protein [Paludibacter sp. 221]|uniref:DUF4302 domain-containing protein n=1 Tax=Paludibacter sp. 221 TaxID=2302939 RepID=UPI0013D47916|nr:DUF4302 domain-containing protein [Paludibacter sp. 221]NDV45592.1 DUF4302 domain-containing protein [Paludibacter sp. 221]